MKTRIVFKTERLRVGRVMTCEAQIDTLTVMHKSIILGPGAGEAAAQKVLVAQLIEVCDSIKLAAEQQLEKLYEVD